MGPAIYRRAAPCLRCCDWARCPPEFRAALPGLELSWPRVATASHPYRLALTFAATEILKELLRGAAASGLVGRQIRFFPDGSTHAEVFGAIPECPACGRNRVGGAAAPPELVWRGAVSMARNRRANR